MLQGAFFPGQALAPFPRTARLLRPSDFDAGARLSRGDGSATGAAATWVFRRHGRWLSLFAWSRQAAAVRHAGALAEGRVVTPAVMTPQALADDHVRIGFTVGKRHARRAVDRNQVKRVLREAARHGRAHGLAAEGSKRAGDAGAPVLAGVDVVLRLKAAWPRQTTHVQRAELRRVLRTEADTLLAALRAALDAGAHHAQGQRRAAPQAGGRRGNAVQNGNLV